MEKQLKLGVKASFLDEEVTRLVQLSTEIPNNYEPVLAHFGPHISPLLPPNELSHQPPGPNVQDSAIMSVCQDAVALDMTSVCQYPQEQDIASESQDPDILHDEDNTKIPQEINDQYPSSDSSYCGSISECEEDTELESTSAPATSSINIVQNDDSYFSSNRDDSRIQSGSESSNKPPLTSKLGEWTAQHNICPNALDKLLKILIDYNNPDLPRCAKTLLKTPRSTRGLITEVAGGQHCYFGISNGISTRITSNFAPNGQSVEVDVFIDGISPYKSAKLHLWVIAGCLTNGKTPPFVISIWCGKIHEPDNVTEFFEDFIQEANLLKTEGFTYNGNIHPFKIRNYIADAPARAMIKCVKKHNSYHGCER